MSSPAKRRFWISAHVVAEEAGYGVTLDARPLRTPAKAPLILPTRALARAIADEWDAQTTEIDPFAMPLTRAANAAIDKVPASHAAVAAMLAEYGGADLICYRAATPEGLVRRQQAAWDPWLDWVRQELRAPLVCVEGVMFAAQPQESLERLAALVAAHDPFELTALHDLVTLSGSLVMGLAVSRGVIGAEAAWAASRIDEDWQAEQWGHDDAADAVAAEKRAAFLSAARFQNLLRALDGDG